MSIIKLQNVRAGLDVDGVLANFLQGFIDAGSELGIQCCLPKDWKKVDRWMFPCVDHFKAIWDAKCEHSYKFWLNLQPLPAAVKYFNSKNAITPELYITKRPCPSFITRKWLRSVEFPDAEVVTVSDPKNKLEIVQERCDVYVDDLPSTVRQMREAGVNALLYSAPFHKGENIEGLPIIKSLSEIRKYV